MTLGRRPCPHAVLLRPMLCVVLAFLDECVYCVLHVFVVVLGVIVQELAQQRLGRHAYGVLGHPGGLGTCHSTSDSTAIDTVVWVVNAPLRPQTVTSLYSDLSRYVEFVRGKVKIYGALYIEL